MSMVPLVSGGLDSTLMTIMAKESGIEVLQHHGAAFEHLLGAGVDQDRAAPAAAAPGRPLLADGVAHAPRQVIG